MGRHARHPKNTRRAHSDSAPSAFDRFRKELQSADSLKPVALHAARELLLRLAAAAGEVTESLADRDEKEVKWWVEALESQCRDALDDLGYLAAALPGAQVRIQLFRALVSGLRVPSQGIC